jgi:hypothetical protein
MGLYALLMNLISLRSQFLSMHVLLFSDKQWQAGLTQTLSFCPPNAPNLGYALLASFLKNLKLLPGIGSQEWPSRQS